MLTYNSTIHVSFLFLGDDLDEPIKYAQRVLRKGNLVKARSSFLAKPIDSAEPGKSLKDWGEKSSERVPNHYFQFTPQHNMLVVSEPIWCECPKHHQMFAKNNEWAEAHLGYVSFIFLVNESLYEAAVPIQDNEGPGEALLRHVSKKCLKDNPALVFIPLVESSRI